MNRNAGNSRTHTETEPAANALEVRLAFSVDWHDVPADACDAFDRAFASGPRLAKGQLMQRQRALYMHQ